MRVNLRRVVTTSLVTLAVACAGAAALADDRVPGDPIPGVPVMVGRIPPPKGTIVAQGTTDAQGIASFTDLEPGTYVVKFETAGKTFRIEANKAGEKITIVSVNPAAEDGAASRNAVKPVVYAKNFSKVAATVEIQGTTMRVGLNTSRSNIKNVK
jgi:hypothetical protein